LSKRNSMTWKHPYSPATKNSKLNHVWKKQRWLCCGIVKSSCCMNFSHQKWQSTVTNTAKFSQYFLKPLNERD
jgi:hypothetical protein